MSSGTASIDERQEFKSFRGKCAKSFKGLGGMPRIVGHAHPYSIFVIHSEHDSVVAPD
jgi:hypothetical protein